MIKTEWTLRWLTGIMDFWPVYDALWPVYNALSLFWRGVWWGMTSQTLGLCFREKHGQCVSGGKPTGTVSFVESQNTDLLRQRTAFSYNSTACMLTGDRTDVSSKSSNQYTIHPELKCSILGVEKMEKNINKHSEKVYNTVLDKLFLTAQRHKSLCNNAMPYYTKSDFTLCSFAINLVFF